MELSRRGFLGGLLAVVSAPAIVRVESLMQLPRPEIIRATVIPLPYKTLPNNLLTIDMITREAVQLFRNSNEFIKSINKEYEKDLAFSKSVQWGSELKFRLPKQEFQANRIAPSIRRFA